MIDRRALSAATALFCAALLTLGCGGDEAGARGQGGGQGHGDGPGGPPGEGRDDAVPVEIAAMARQSMGSLYATSATLRASRQATVTTRTQGVVNQLLVEEGDLVTEGQTLARLENDKQTIDADRARATLETRKGEYDRLQSLFEQALVSEDEYEKARREWRDAQHAADLAVLELSRTAISAPFAGVVVRRHIDVGNTLTASTPVYDLADVTPLNVDVNVPERHVARLRAGQQVRLLSDATEQSVDASIERIAPAVDAGTGTVKVTLAVAANDGLRPGTFVRVEIITDTHEDALVAPRSALVAEGRRWFIYRVADDGATAEKMEIELGYESQDLVEVLPKGEDVELGEGDQVVVAGAGALEDGSALDVMGDEPAEGEEVAAEEAMEAEEPVEAEESEAAEAAE